MAPYVDAVVAVTVMRVLLFVLHVCMLRECDCVRLTAILVLRVDVVSGKYMGGTRGSGIVSSAADVLWMSVVCGMRGVGRVCGLYQLCGSRGSVGRVSVYWLRWCVW